MACCDACAKSGGSCGGSEPGTGTCTGNKMANGPNSGCGWAGKPFGMNADLPKDTMSALAGPCCLSCGKSGQDCCGKQQWADASFGLSPDLAPDVRASLAGFEEVVEGLGDVTTTTTTPMTWGQVLGVAVPMLALGGFFGWVAAKAHSGEGPYGKINPAHENFVGRRVELHPGHDLWMRGARYGKVVRVKGDTLSIRMDNKAVRSLVRVRKDRVTLI